MRALWPPDFVRLLRSFKSTDRPQTLCPRSTYHRRIYLAAHELISTFLRPPVSTLAATPIANSHPFYRRSLAELEGLAGFENEGG
jgi:hypothetical protein